MIRSRILLQKMTRKLRRQRWSNYVPYRIFIYQTLPQMFFSGNDESNQSCGPGFIESGSGYGSGSSILSEFGSRVLMTKNWKNTARNFLKSFLIKYWNLLRSKLQEQPSDLKKEHPALQTMKFINFFYVCGSFLPFWIRNNPDPQH
jgi:hypothetical protein